MSTIKYFLYNQYDIPKSDLMSRTLCVSVWDWDRFGSNDFLGEVQLHLSSLDLTDTVDHWYRLQDKVNQYCVAIHITTISHKSNSYTTVSMLLLLLLLFSTSLLQYDGNQLQPIRRSVDGTGNNDLEATEISPEHQLDLDAAQIKDIKDESLNTA